MPIIDKDLFRIVRDLIKASIPITSKLGVDRNGNPIIKPIESSLRDVELPAIVIEITEGNSEAVFPASRDTLRIVFWTSTKKNIHQYSFRKGVIDDILALFNRKVSSMSSIDVPTNTGFRTAFSLKQSVTFGKDEEIDRNFVEAVFIVTRSEGESFDPLDSGDKTWI